MPELEETGLAQNSDMCSHLCVNYSAKVTWRLGDLDCSRQNWKIGDVDTGPLLAGSQPHGLCFCWVQPQSACTHSVVNVTDTCSKSLYV